MILVALSLRLLGQGCQLLGILTAITVLVARLALAVSWCRSIVPWLLACCCCFSLILTSFRTKCLCFNSQLPAVVFALCICCCLCSCYILIAHRTKIGLTWDYPSIPHLFRYLWRQITYSSFFRLTLILDCYKGLYNVLHLLRQQRNSSQLRHYKTIYEYQLLEVRPASRLYF